MKSPDELKIYYEEDKMNVVCHFDRDEISFILSKYVMDNVSLPHEDSPYEIYGNDVRYYYNENSHILRAEVEIKAKKATEEPKK